VRKGIIAVKRIRSAGRHVPMNAVEGTVRALSRTSFSAQATRMLQ
jgi:hypothetical protein